MNYFRGDAAKDAILSQNMTELMNYKLTPNTVNSAEGYNNKFNDIINTLQQQGHSLSPPISSKVYTLQISKMRLMSISVAKPAQMPRLPALEFNQPYSESTCWLLEKEGEAPPLRQIKHLSII